MKQGQQRPRIRVPVKARVGDIIEIKTSISHRMESGQRISEEGKKIPRRIINAFTAAFNGNVFFEADWHPAISANPYQAFFYKARESGEFTFSWKDDNGEYYIAKKKLLVG